ncbi:hypothetical protein HY969_00510 [Candidatus Kaiserbacteria bacterium]|nr:hypothetical protein [Candidatus Kaiserbacteria bacterium]
MSAKAITPEDLRSLIIAELSLGHLSENEQDQIIGELGRVLLDRATLEVMKLVPSEAFEVVDELIDKEMYADAQELIQKHVPNMETVMMEAVRAGIEEHKQRVNSSEKE